MKEGVVVSSFPVKPVCVTLYSSILSYVKFPKFCAVGVAVRSLTNVSLVFADGFTSPLKITPRPLNPACPVPGHHTAPLICS